VLQHFMQHPGKEHLLCRCRAVEAAGIIVSTLGAKDPVIGPHIAPMMEAVLAGACHVRQILSRWDGVDCSCCYAKACI
jgi:hypothetical protein